jgi:hypothetical protein
LKIKELYEKAIEVGRANDPRGEEGIAKFLAKEKRQYERLGKKKDEAFDTERLTNPYPDTRILNGPDDIEVKSVMVGVDLETPELLLAERLREKGTEIDLCVAHHPEGHALANLFRVMDLQADVMAKLGIPINVAEGILDPRVHEVKRSILVRNHMRAVDAARLLGFPFMCLHTVADNCVNTYLQKTFDEEKPDTVGDVIDLLEDIPEYKLMKRRSTGLVVLARSAKSVEDVHRIRAGQILVDMTGGTGGSKEMFEKLATNTQVGTFVGMHISDRNLDVAKENHINVIVAGHMASDSLGLNLLLGEVLKGTNVRIIPCSGYDRVERN